MANVPILQTVADLTASQIAGAASALLPSGVILPFAGSTAPSGWLLCDGSEISKTTYANLFTVISSGGVGLYDTQTNPTTGSAYAAPAAGNFRVPDYRGIFLRGVGTPSGLDAVTLGSQQAQKTAKNGLANSTSSITAQTAVIVPNSAQDIADTANSTFSAPGFRAKVWNAPNTNVSVTGTAAAQTLTGDNETRPINKGVNYIIKI